MSDREDNSLSDAILQAAFQACEQQGCPLTSAQQAVLAAAIAPHLGAPRPEARNPLDELTPEERDAFLAFVADNQTQERSWQAQLLNDWLIGGDSGPVQFIRSTYGLAWIERVQTYHIAAYQRPERLRVGDRIEVANTLWEWVQTDDPGTREWLPCTVLWVREEADLQEGRSLTSCTVRFDTGMEYEIQGVYDWNRYNWRWVGEMD